MADKRGEWGPTMDATEDIQEICDQVKDEVEKKTEKVYVVFRAVKYRKWIYIPQMCGAPLQFLIKVHVGGVDYIHLWVLQKVDCENRQVNLFGVKQSETKESPLEQFPIE